MIGKGKGAKTPKKSKPPRAPKTPKARRAKAEGAWVTPEGYRFAARLAALDPHRPGGDLIVTLANEILDQQVRLGRRGLAVCAPAEGAGVTFVAANLAIALAQAGVATLLVDANLDTPSLDELIAPPAPAPGLSDLLGDETLDLLDVIRPDVLPGLSIVYAGEGDAGSDRLVGDRFQTFAERCLRDFGLTIFDTPPANRSTGARAVGVAAGYALLVARRDNTFADDVNMLNAQLEQDGVLVLGSILNCG